VVATGLLQRPPAPPLHAAYLPTTLSDPLHGGPLGSQPIGLDTCSPPRAARHRLGQCMLVTVTTDRQANSTEPSPPPNPLAADTTVRRRKPCLGLGPSKRCFCQHLPSPLPSPCARPGTMQPAIFSTSTCRSTSRCKKVALSQTAHGKYHGSKKSSSLRLATVSESTLALSGLL